MTETPTELEAALVVLRAEPRATHLAISLQGLLLIARDALRSGDPADRALLLRMTDDRGELMDRLRRDAVDDHLMTLFERAVSSLRRLAQA
ncbi:MAG: hypothetical protein FJ027_10415 [Candidatus Rokubacteria bacterium]|nr:hypothetical protein [Candidatus Rokubacteria bacterium]